jgi:Protein of unknown function (DUF4239)
MSDWLHNLPVLWMALVVFGATYLATAAIYGIVNVLASGERARAFKAVTPGILSPLGILFGLYLAFTAAQVWSDIDRANAAVNREASALSAIVILADGFPGEPEERMRALVRRYIETTAGQEWPQMAHLAFRPGITPAPLAEALQLTLSLTPQSRGQETAQPRIAAAIENALDARLQRIIVSQSQVNLVKWLCLFALAICVLVAVAMMHNDNRRTSAITMTLFATAVGASILLISAHNRPFAGEVSVGPEPLLRVMPEVKTSLK